ncbi:hypothetical protein [Paenibacillus sp. GCM10028914]|uniref:hypothetical protein n=1 Tax=Paenibacillus sp. GCM10028914 TaxID=3273416 RepID=UPI00362219E4
MKGFQIITESDFAKFKEDNELEFVNFELQAKNLIEADEIIFLELDDGYATLRLKKGFGLSKGKFEFCVCGFGEQPQVYYHKNFDKGIKMFSQLHSDGQNFFYVKGLR